MKTIETKYIGPGNVRGSRFVATDGDGNRVVVSYDYSLNSEDNHKRAAVALCHKMHWHGQMVSGSTKAGMVHVFVGRGGETPWDIPLRPLTPEQEELRRIARDTSLEQHVRIAAKNKLHALCQA